MDNTLQRFEAFPSYVSCIKNYGRPILPPLLSSSQRQEMAEIRHQAIIAEARIARRSIQKSSLMDKAKEIMEKIEKSQISLLDSGAGDNSLSSAHQSATSSVHSFPPCTILLSQQGDNAAVTSSDQGHAVTDSSILNGNFGNQETECCVSETDDTCSQSSAFEETSSHATYSVADSDQSDVMSSVCDQRLILSTNDGFSESSQRRNSEASQLSSMCFPLDNSVDFEPHVISSGDEWVENGDSSGAYKTSDLEETENTSMATVVLRVCDELPNDTDSDSVITSAAQSTDLEKYFDSPGDCQFSESSEQTGRENKNDCSVRSISSDFESSATLVNSDAELTPIPCLEVAVESRNGSRCESSPFTCGRVKGSPLQERRKPGGFQGHVRRSSYTLDKPSPALLQAFAGSPCDTNCINSENSPYGNNIDLKKSEVHETVEQISLSESACLEDELTEASDLLCAKKMPARTSEVRQWAYKVPHDFCDNSDQCDSSSLRNGSCDISEKIYASETFDNNSLYGQEMLSDSKPTVVNPIPNSLSLSQTRTLGSAFEANVSEQNSVEIDKPAASFNHSNFSGKVDTIDEKILAQIFQNLQELQRQQVEKLQEEQRQQWDKLHQEFQEQEAILHNQLKSLYVCTQPDCPPNDESLEAAKPSVLDKSLPEWCTNGPNCVIYSSQISPLTSSFSTHSSEEQSTGKESKIDVNNDPVLKAKLDKISAAVKGYLTRRLLKTERVQGIIQTIKDTLVCAVKFHEETPVKKGFITEQDADLHQRLISQITAACCELHDIFFRISTKERMLLISQSRELARNERNKSGKEESATAQMNSSVRRSPRSKTRPILSSATIKYLERKNLRSSSEGKGLGVANKSKASTRVIQKRPSSASGRRNLSSPPTSLRSTKLAPYGKNSTSAKSPNKNVKSVRRLIYSRTES